MKKLFFLIFLIFMMNLVVAAHYIVGNVKNSFSGEEANGKEAVIWNPANGIDDNLTDVVGPAGNSNADNVFLIDCEMLTTPCSVGDEIKIDILDYPADEVNLSVSGAGYDIAGNISLNSPPNITSLIVDDALTSPAWQVDLQAASTRTVTCEAIVNDFDGDLIQNSVSEFYSTSLGAPDDNNEHYTNDSCYINSSYGNANQTQIMCSYEVWYYANPGTWNCYVQLEDNHSASTNLTNTTTINTLLSVGTPDRINYTVVDSEAVSDEVPLNITNYGNVMINLSLTSYGGAIGDGLAMNCSSGNITAQHEKYNLTSSNSGALTLSQADTLYTNMSGQTQIKEFNLDYKTDDSGGDVLNWTYWRIYVPKGVKGECSGNVIVGANQDSE